MIRQTSLFAYADLLPKLNRLEKIVLNCIAEHSTGINDRQIAIETGLEKNCVNGRRNALMKKGLIREAIRSTDIQTGKLVIFWKLSRVV